MFPTRAAEGGRQQCSIPFSRKGLFCHKQSSSTGARGGGGRAATAATGGGGAGVSLPVCVRVEHGVERVRGRELRRRCVGPVRGGVPLPSPPSLVASLPQPPLLTAAATASSGDPSGGSDGGDRGESRGGRGDPPPVAHSEAPAAGLEGGGDGRALPRRARCCPRSRPYRRPPRRAAAPPPLREAHGGGENFPTAWAHSPRGGQLLPHPPRAPLRRAKGGGGGSGGTRGPAVGARCVGARCRRGRQPVDTAGGAAAEEEPPPRHRGAWGGSRPGGGRRREGAPAGGGERRRQ